MKTILIIFLAILFLAGCETSSDEIVNAPGNNSLTSETEIFDYELIQLPKKSVMWIDSVLSLSNEIDGSIGGRMVMEKYFLSEDGDSIVVEADLRIPAGAFQGTKTITITVDAEYAAIKFYPEMIFDDTLILFQSFKGLNLENYQTGTIDYVYVADDGSIETVKKNGVQVIVPQRIMKVQNAKLLHFSRYGWIRKQNNGN
jgi:hypothetical protein